jgi:hypothetical protein
MDSVRSSTWKARARAALERLTNHLEHTG